MVIIPDQKSTVPKIQDMTVQGEGGGSRQNSSDGSRKAWPHIPLTSVILYSQLTKHTQVLNSEWDPEQPIKDMLFRDVTAGLPLSLGSICYIWQWGIQAQGWDILRKLTTLSRIFTRFQPLCQVLVDQAESCIPSETNPPELLETLATRLNQTLIVRGLLGSDIGTVQWILLGSTYSIWLIYSGTADILIHLPLH